MAFRKRLFGGPWLGKPCAACGHPIAPGLGEVQHQLSWRTRPDLAWQMTYMGQPQLVPVHAGGRKRCPDPACDLACNAILGGNACPRDELGRPVLPFPAAFLADKQAERRQHRERGRHGFSAKPPGSARRTREPAETPRRSLLDAGRNW